MSETAEYLIETADRCIRLAKTGRRLSDELGTLAAAEKSDQLAHLADMGKDVADELEVLGRDLMTKAVEIDTVRQKGKPSAFGP
jgi:hypothetical protein